MLEIRAIERLHTVAGLPQTREAVVELETISRLPPALPNTDAAKKGLSTTLGLPQTREAITEVSTMVLLPLASPNQNGAIERLHTVAGLPQTREAVVELETISRLPPALPNTDAAKKNATTSEALPQARGAEGSLTTGKELLPAPPIEIGAKVALTTEHAMPRERPAQRPMDTNGALPAAFDSEIEAITLMETIAALPRTQETRIDLATEAGLSLASSLIAFEESQRRTVDQYQVAPFEAGKRRTVDPALSGHLLLLKQLQRTRRFCIVSQSRIDRSTEAFIALQWGLDRDAPEAERKKAWTKITAYRKNVERDAARQSSATQVTVDAGRADGGGQSVADNREAVAAPICTPVILAAMQSRAPWDRVRNQAEKEMRRVARTLPAWSYVEPIRGLSDLGLAIILAETGDLGLYETKERVWKRLGLAVINGERQRRVAGEAALQHGFSPQRRAEIWSLCSDSMLRQQVRSGKDGSQGFPIGIYGAVYYARKANTQTREGWSAARRDNDARRIMTKVVIENIWRNWNGLNEYYPEAAHELWEAYGNTSMQQVTKRLPPKLPRYWTTIATRSATDTRWINVPDSGLSSTLAMRLHENARINIRYKTINDVSYMQAKKANVNALNGVPSPILELAE